MREERRERSALDPSRAARHHAPQKTATGDVPMKFLPVLLTAILLATGTVAMTMTPTGAAAQNRDPSSSACSWNRRT